MKLKPIYNRLVIKRTPAETISGGGIVLALDEPEKKPEGVVMAVGHDVSVNVGDTVLFRKVAGTEVKVGGEDLLVMTEDDVIAVIT
jgi:chaperonin GroES